MFPFTDLLSLLLPGEAGPLRRNACGCASEVQHGSVCWKLVSKCLLFCMRLYSCFMLYRICSKRKKLKFGKIKTSKLKKKLVGPIYQFFSNTTQKAYVLKGTGFSISWGLIRKQQIHGTLEFSYSTMTFFLSTDQQKTKFFIQHRDKGL